VAIASAPKTAGIADRLLAMTQALRLPLRLLAVSFDLTTPGEKRGILHATAEMPLVREGSVAPKDCPHGSAAGIGTSLPLAEVPHAAKPFPPKAVSRPKTRSARRRRRGKG
jgi:hypothetical protein